jgi:hypothetical protein
VSTDPGHSPPHHPHGSPVVRALFGVAGLLALGLGIAGAFLPVLPTTPLVLLAAACFARSYRPFHEWLLAHRHFGPIVHDWHAHRSVSRRTKLVAISTMAASLGFTIVFVLESPWARAGLAAFGIGLAVWMARLPSRR